MRHPKRECGSTNSQLVKSPVFTNYSPPWKLNGQCLPYFCGMGYPGFALNSKNE